jgi:hypothetical protein
MECVIGLDNGIPARFPIQIIGDGFFPRSQVYCPPQELGNAFAAGNFMADPVAKIPTQVSAK